MAPAVPAALPQALMVTRLQVPVARALWGMVIMAIPVDHTGGHMVALEGPREDHRDLEDIMEDTPANLEDRRAPVQVVLTAALAAQDHTIGGKRLPSIGHEDCT
ncbi:hypothetical protein N7492_001036 [Penicillium capsulatum]|uniref:Uncharacterized protein n=1 Tax=Penicillium capsulatum TaxID=69766 RepID=A0A9W9IUS3_9EURO|nr:hypothetical protein N7492_001036 [Penicillium capsulatum]